MYTLYTNLIVFFSIDQFAEIYGKKLGMNIEGLCNTLWGDYYLNSKTKRVMKGAQVSCEHKKLNSFYEKI